MSQRENGTHLALQLNHISKTTNAIAEVTAQIVVFVGKMWCER
jgi:hypothetical protein